MAQPWSLFSSLIKNGRRRQNFGRGLALTFNSEHLAAFVKAAAWAHAVCLGGLAALRAVLDLGQRERAIGGQALTAAAA